MRHSSVFLVSSLFGHSKSDFTSPDLPGKMEQRESSCQLLWLCDTFPSFHWSLLPQTRIPLFLLLPGPTHPIALGSSRSCPRWINCWRQPGFPKWIFKHTLLCFLHFDLLSSTLLHFPPHSPSEHSPLPCAKRSTWQWLTCLGKHMPLPFQLTYCD